MDQRVLIRGLN